MICYFDTSFILSAVLEERPQEDHAAWDQASERLASDLLRFECWAGLRQAALQEPEAGRDKWTSARGTQIDRFLDKMTFKSIDDAIERIVRGENGLAGCRTLDAIHVATALYFAPHLDEPLVICSFDRRLRSAAEGLKLQTYPRLGAGAHEEGRG